MSWELLINPYLHSGIGYPQFQGAASATLKPITWKWKRFKMWKQSLWSEDEPETLSDMEMTRKKKSGTLGQKGFMLEYYK